MGKQADLIDALRLDGQQLLRVVSRLLLCRRFLPLGEDGLEVLGEAKALHEESLFGLGVRYRVSLDAAAARRGREKQGEAARRAGAVKKGRAQLKKGPARG